MAALSAKNKIKIGNEHIMLLFCAKTYSFPLKPHTVFCNEGLSFCAKYNVFTQNSRLYVYVVFGGVFLKSTEI